MKTAKKSRRTFKSMKSGRCGKSCSGKYKKRSFWSKLFGWLFGYSSRTRMSSGKRMSSGYSGRSSKRKIVSLRAKKSRISSRSKRNKKMAA